MAHTPQEDPGERRVGWPKRLALTSELSEYPRPLIDHADFVISCYGSIVKNRSGHRGISATSVERRSCKIIDPAEAKILLDEGAWRGQPPAEGTRRAIILEAVKRGDVLSDSEALDIADTVESALLHQNPRIFDSGRRDFREALLGVLKGHNARLSHGHGGKLSEANAVDLANEVERALEKCGFWPPPRLVPPIDDEARERLAAVLTEGIESVSPEVQGAPRRRVLFATLDRMYKDKTFWPLTPAKCADALERALKDFDGTVEDEVERLDNTACDVPDREAELLEQHEEARTREGRFAEERDCAYALLRWLLPVTVAKRID